MRPGAWVLNLHPLTFPLPFALCPLPSALCPLPDIFFIPVRRLILPLFAIAALVAATSSSLPAQLRLQPVAGMSGDTELELLLRKLRTTGTFMMTTAHPDDENNALLALMSHGLGLRTVLVTATRGDGGQNEIGPEIFDALAVLRTEELLAAHRFDGPEQYFTRAVDFGYSFSVDETYEKWGKDEIVADYVRHIRTIRPDVIVGFVWEGTGGGLHHQASTRLTAEAFRAAADPTRYPEQIKEGLRPWQATKFYYTSGGGGGRGGGPTESLTPVATGAFDAALGRTYEEVGAEGRSMHRCQDFPQLLPLPFAGGARGGGGSRGYHLQDCTIPGQLQKQETSLLDGLDLSLPGLTRFVPPGAVASNLQAPLRAIAQAAGNAQIALKLTGASAAVPHLVAGLRQVRTLRANVAEYAIDDTAKYELDFRLQQKERQFQDALIVAASVRLEAIADDMTATPGQPVAVQLHVANRGTVPVTLTKATAGGTNSTACPLREFPSGASQQCIETVTIDQVVRISDVPFTHEPGFARYVYDSSVPFGVPFAPTPYRATFGLTIGGEPVEKRLDVEARNGTDMVAGEKRSEILVVPALTVTVSPDVIVVPTGAASKRDLRVTVRNNGKGPAQGIVRLTAPRGWTVTPASSSVTVAREDEEATVRFVVSAPGGLKPSSAEISAEIQTKEGSFASGYQVVEYPHIRRRLLFRPAAAAVKVVDVKVAAGLTVGYVMGAGDRVPQAIAQLGVPVTLLSDDDLAWGDLSRYRVIMTGVRAYENRDALKANNQRLMQYVRNGGVVLVNYNRTEFNQAQYGPYPAQVSSNRITDERAPIRVLVPAHPVFTAPNKIGPATWANWVQERGTYFLGERSKEYVDLIESEDPFPNNAGPKRGALVEARLGKGRWVYIGLVLWRELPAGVPGAYQLLGNLLSLGAPAQPN